MRKHLLPLAWCLAAVACAAEPPANAAAPAADPETVLVTYRITAGKEANFLKLVKAQWQTLQKLHAVTDAPHTFLRGREAKGGVYFVEVFTWTSASIPDHAPAEVQAIWSELGKVCEARDGHAGIEIVEVDPIDADR